MIKKILIGLALNAFALYGTAELIDEVTIVGGIQTYAYASIIIAALNLLVKPALKLVTFPLKFLTLGLSIVAINIFIFFLADQAMDTLFGIKYDIVIQEDLVTYIKSGIIFGVLNWLEHLIIK